MERNSRFFVTLEFYYFLVYRVQLEQAISIIKKLLSVLNSVDVIKLYGAPLGRALEHPDVQAKELVLNEVRFSKIFRSFISNSTDLYFIQLNRAASNVDLLTIICKEIPLLASVIECIKSETLSLASTATQFLNELGKIQPGIAVLFSPPLINHLENVAAANDTVKLRVHEVSILYVKVSYYFLVVQSQSALIKRWTILHETGLQLIKMC